MAIGPNEPGPAQSRLKVEIKRSTADREGAGEAAEHVLSLTVRALLVETLRIGLLVPAVEVVDAERGLEPGAGEIDSRPFLQSSHHVSFRLSIGPVWGDGGGSVGDEESPSEHRSNSRDRSFHNRIAPGGIDGGVRVVA